MKYDQNLLAVSTAQYTAQNQPIFLTLIISQPIKKTSATADKVTGPLEHVTMLLLLLFYPQV